MSKPSKAIDELLLAGFDHADINVLAHEDTIASKLGPSCASTAEFEDDPEAPRIAYIPDETIGNAEGAVIGAGVYLPAIFGSLAVAASGGTLLGVFAAAAIAGHPLRISTGPDRIGSLSDYARPARSSARR
ncbi:MAG TPA: hypothetical protein VH858_11335 [Hyphomicrobiales bacterium]|jgi:hypothetical protein